MKILSLILMTSFIASNAFAGVCDLVRSSEGTRKFECESIGDESTINTSEGRIIFISKTACVELNSKTISVSLQNPGNGKIKMDVDKKNKSIIKAKISDRIYPSGNITNSYVDEIELELSELKSDAPKLSVKRYTNHTLKKDEVRYLADYSCSEVK